MSPKRIWSVVGITATAFTGAGVALGVLAPSGIHFLPTTGTENLSRPVAAAAPRATADRATADRATADRATADRSARETAEITSGDGHEATSAPIRPHERRTTAPESRRTKVVKAVLARYPHARIQRLVPHRDAVWVVTLKLRDHRVGVVTVDKRLRVGAFTRLVVRLPVHRTPSAVPTPSPTPSSVPAPAPTHW